jgi:hypothetical protein
MSTQNIIQLSVKQLGKRRAIIEQIPLLISDKFYENPTLEQFLRLVVTQQVEQFNDKVDRKNILPFLSSKEIEERANHGKISFGEIYNSEKANIEKAIDTAIQSFEDGIFLVLIDGEKKENLSETIDLKQGSEVVFIRLTMLVGSYF